MYLDHAGAALYSEPQMADVVKDLTSNVYGNPRILGSRCQETLFYFLLSVYQCMCCEFLWMWSLTYLLDSQSDSSMAATDLVTAARHQVHFWLVSSQSCLHKQWQ